MARSTSSLRSSTTAALLAGTLLTGVPTLLVRRRVADMPDFEEVAPRVWVAHYDWMHVNIVLVGGSDGLVMVDTHGSAKQARIVADDVRRLGAGPLTALVNTHEHWDHHFGNATMVEQFGDMPIHATEWARDHVETSAGHTFDMYEQATDHPRR